MQNAFPGVQCTNSPLKIGKTMIRGQIREYERATISSIANTVKY